MMILRLRESHDGKERGRHDHMPNQAGPEQLKRRALANFINSLSPINTACDPALCPHFHLFSNFDQLYGHSHLRFRWSICASFGRTRDCQINGRRIALMRASISVFTSQVWGPTLLMLSQFSVFGRLLTSPSSLDLLNSIRLLICFVRIIFLVYHILSGNDSTWERTD